MLATGQTSAPTGLSTAEAEQRLREFGPNISVSKLARPPWLDLLVLFTNPLSLVLLTAAFVSALLGQSFDAGLIAALVLIGTLIDFVQTFRSRKVIEHLRSKVAATASVMRDGEWHETERQLLVPGDLIRLSAGDLVPADANLITSKDLYVQQAMLTGESVPAEKMCTSDLPSRLATALNMVFLGTSVVSGYGLALVTATGSKTAFGDITARLAARAPETAFDAGLRRFGYLITRVVFSLVLFVLVMNLAFHRPPLASLLFAVALAVGLTPEFLPMITSVTLSRGALAMARQKVIVKHLPAIQNLGSMDILCSDKTGTLTTGSMVLHASVDPFGEPSQHPLYSARTNSQLQTGIRNPLDTAILSYSPVDVTPQPVKVDEIPFDFQRRRLSVIVRQAELAKLICKGSLEGLLPLITGIEQNGTLIPINADLICRIQTFYKEQSSEGYRILAVATRNLPLRESYASGDEQQLTLEGFLLFTDPILKDAAETVAKLRADGVQVKILSGDSDLVTTHICAEAGIPVTGVVLGDDLDGISDPALQHLAEQSNVFARVSPAQKVRILTALKRRGHVVGFMGDGINDAPALHTADVGIAAPNAVDIAQDAADVVLLQPGLQVLHQGILEGRRAFGNVMKYLLMGTSSNFGNVLSMAVASLALPFLPMLPTQILLNNFLYDLSQLTIPTDNVDSEYIRKPQQWDISVVRRFMVLIGPISSLYDFLTFYVLLRVLHTGEKQFHTGWFVESLATQTLVLLVIRTMGSPFRSRPSPGLLATVLIAVSAGIWLPYSRFAGVLGFTTLPFPYFCFLAVATGTYLAMVEWAKRKVMPRPPETASLPKDISPDVLPVACSGGNGDLLRAGVTDVTASGPSSG